MAKKSFDIKIASKDSKDIITSVGEFTQASKEPVVLPELENFITPLSKESYSQLEENILNEGIREPLIVWINGDQEILIDGHNRFQIAKVHNIPYKKARKSFKGLDEAKKWMIQNQLGRRNLTDLELSYFRGLLYNQKKQGWGGKRETEGTGTSTKTAQLIADEYKVNERTILRDERLYQGIEKVGKSNPELKRQILSGEVRIPKGKIQKLAEIAEWKGVTDLSEINRVLADNPVPVKISENSQLNELIHGLKQVLEDIARTRTSERVADLEKGIQQLKAILTN
ncbi:MAG: hypothetical protein KKD75_02710 [Nanoarchaeota archaeon]|nr:hypothetical protein [Nanoarchaeota archaeon]